MDIVGPAGRGLARYQALHRRFAKHASTIAIVGLPVAAFLLFLFAVSVSFCGEGCGFGAATFLLPLVYAAFTAFTAALAFVIARRALRRLRRDLVVTTAMRVQSLKDWFVRGDITEDEYETLRAKMLSVSEGSAPHMQAQDAAAFYSRFAIVLWVTVWPAAALFTISFLALTDGVTVAVPFALFSLLGLVANAWGIFYGMRRAKDLGDAHKRLGLSLIREIEDGEAQLLRLANERHGGTPRPSSPQPYRRASYQNFMGR